MIRTDKVRDTMRMVQHDCATDATAVDSTPFTARGVGETFGSTLAMVAAVARAAELLADEIDALQRVLNSRTEHLV